jgi:single-strand DNA-binding protein
MHVFETPFFIVGTIVTDPILRRVGEQQVVKFRVASNSRRRTAEGEEAGNSLFVNVNCWGRLVDGVSGTLSKGDPVVVVGHLYTSEYDDRDGNRRSSAEVRAFAVGPDVARSTVRIEARKRADGDVRSDPAETDAPTDEDPMQDRALPTEGMAASLRA